MAENSFSFDWHVAVYCANEAARLGPCLASIATALGDRRALVTVLLNGSHDASLDIACAAARSHPATEVIRIAAADKSNAINQFNHRLRRPARAYAGVDGYVVVGAHSFAAMEQRLAEDAHVQAVSGIATSGRTMRGLAQSHLATGGHLQGQFHALRADFVDRMVEGGLRLPVGLYRGDGLLGSMLAHDLDARGNSWDSSRSVAVAGATYHFATLSPLRPRDIQRQFRRKLRQMRGGIENAAIKDIIYRVGYEALPADADAMIRAYLAANPPPPTNLADRLFQRMAIRESLAATAPEPTALEPHRVVV